MISPPISDRDYGDYNDGLTQIQIINSTQEQSDQENLHPPQPSETLNLEEEETSPQNLYLLDPLSDDENQDDPDGSNASSPPQASLAANTVSRRGKKRKKEAQRRRAAQERKKRMKLETLLSKFKPMPFVPAEALDFAGHEKLLQRLGLWDFVHLEFDSNVRVDLVAQLIANFDSSQRASHVNGVRILLNVTDMARALRLPPPPGKKYTGATVDGTAKDLESGESIAFVEDLVSNWMLLHGEVRMMPDEVMKMLNVIKEGHLEKVEWATLIWFMVEKELMLAPHLEDCYYASHLQCLIKLQHEELFKEEPKVEVDVKEQEALDGNDDDVKMVDATEVFQVAELEEHKIELRLGLQGNAEEDDGNECGDGDVVKDDDLKECAQGEDDVGFEECKGEEPVHCFSDGGNNGGECYLQRCNLGYIKDSEQEEEEEEEEEDQQDDGFHLSPNPFGPELQLHNHSPGNFLSDHPSLFGNTHKREYGNENAISHSYGGLNKRLRSDGSFDNKSDDFHSCMDQVQHFLGKARMMYDTKEHASAESSKNQQVLLNELQQRDHTIHNLHNQRLAEQHKTEVHTYRLECELAMMGSLLQNYRKALKETQRAFSEYRAKFPQPDEPLYKDVPESGGLVLSTTELEKHRLKQLEKIRLNQMVNDFAAGRIDTFNGHLDEVHLLESKLLGIDKEVQSLKELSLKRNLTERTSE